MASPTQQILNALAAWKPLYDTDNEINGGDLVEWLGEVMPLLPDALREQEQVQAVLQALRVQPVTSDARKICRAFDAAEERENVEIGI